MTSRIFFDGMAFIFSFAAGSSAGRGLASQSRGGGLFAMVPKDEDEESCSSRSGLLEKVVIKMPFPHA